MDVKSYEITFTANFLHGLNVNELREILNMGLKILNWGKVNFDIKEVSKK